jgi:hypothetical protein
MPLKVGFIPGFRGLFTDLSANKLNRLKGDHKLDKKQFALLLES